MTADPLHWLSGELQRLDREGLRRRLAVRTGPSGPLIRLREQSLVNFGSNDYLGLAADERLAAAARKAIEEEGWGAGASPLISGHTEWHAQLETRLAEFTGCEAALVFPSGYAGNSGCIPALVGHGDAILSDAGNHASLIDGCRLARAEVFVYEHRRLDRLEEQLQAARRFRRRLIVTDSLFSMDGDAAALATLAQLAAEHDCMLLVDEAHATGVFGARGTGLIEAAHVQAGVHVRVGTLSKALGSAGGFVAGRRELIEWLINRARPYVFSTGHPPAAAAAALAALEVVEAEPERRQQLLERAACLRRTLVAAGWDVGDSLGQIIPLFVGQPERALRLAAALRDQGLFVPAIRPPSVPPGRSLLRISLSYFHSPPMLERLVAALCKLAGTQ